MTNAMFCDHANECGVNCTCPSDCYCRIEGTCRTTQNMYQPQKCVEQFHKTFGCVHNDRVTDLNTATRLLRARLVTEEAAEFVAALAKNDTVAIADSIADLLYVTYGAAVAFGMDAQALFNEVHKSNMTKSPTRDGSGKVLKGPNYRPPKLEKILWPDELFDNN